jgi:hypothetical protein
MNALECREVLHLLEKTEITLKVRLNICRIKICRVNGDGVRAGGKQRPE